ncbi:endochitinase A [Fagus crenata]
MRSTSKVIMGATLVMVVSLAIVVGLILVLLAELYCSLLLRRRQLRNTNSDTTTTATAIATATITANTPSSQPSQPQNQSSHPPLSSFYAPGVLHAPRSFLFPAVSGKVDNAEETKKQHSQLHHVIDVQTQESNTSPTQIGLVSASSPPSPFIHTTTPKPIQEGGGGGNTCNDKATGCVDQFMYISNPIYDNDDNDGRPSRVDTPFETPDTSPSRLEMGGSSGDDEVSQTSLRSPSSPTTPPLTPMKKLPAEACSVSLRDATSLGTSGSESNTNNGHSSSSSGSPCTSPSW